MTAIAPDAQVSSTDAAHLAGITYRQLDYLATHLGWNPGSGGGSRRRWSYDQIHRLRIAAALNEAVALKGLTGAVIARIPEFGR